MLVVQVKDGENIDRALKRLKRKFQKTGNKNALRERKKYTKPSIKKRAQMQKAQYIQKLRDSESN